MGGACTRNTKSIRFSQVKADDKENIYRTPSEHNKTISMPLSAKPELSEAGVSVSPGTDGFSINI